ncbi:MAG UNVERIFIED_CONTAM: hypothetical protein LVQ98_07360 [Rickettsiaceae bacterium]|jgi:hypothetical protein
MAQRTDDPGNAQPNAAAATRAGNPLQGDHLTFTGAEITIGADNAPRIHHFASKRLPKS